MTDGTSRWVYELYETLFPNKFDSSSGTPNQNYVLTSDGDNTLSWNAVSGSGLVALNDITDVTISSPATGTLLFYNGSNWVNATSSDTIIIPGNLTVSGTTTTINTETIELADNIIILNSNATGNATENAGIEVERGDDVNVVLRYNETNDKWEFTNDGSSYVSIATDTDSLAEGSNNLYYNQTRFDTAFSAKSTSDLSEGTNLYYTSTRFDTAFSGKDTDDLSEGSTNIYFTNARAVDAIEAVADATPVASDKVIFNDAGELKQVAFSSLTNAILSGIDSGDITEVVAGAGLTDGGSSGSVTLNVGAGTGITVNADDIQISATYTGQNTITTLGTILTGTWNGTSIADAYIDDDITLTNITQITNRSHSDLQSIGASDHHTKYALTDDLTSSEITQIQNIDSTTISTTQWGYLGELDQSLTTTSDVTFGEVEGDEFIGDHRGAVIFKAKAGEGLTKGDAVYISSFDTVGNTPIVAKADADDVNKMPSFGLAQSTVSLNASVDVVTFGTLSGLDTSSFSLGDVLYVSTTAGGLTDTAPSGESSYIQNIAKVTRSHASSGSVKVGGAGRFNAVSNLNDGNIFIGNSSNQATTSTLDTSIVPENTNLYYTDARARSSVSASGDLSYSSSTGVFSFTETHLSRAGSYDYLSVSDHAITLGQIDLTTDVTGVLPSANLDSDTAHLSTDQTFTGAKRFDGQVNIDTDTNTLPLIISRLGSTTNENLKIGVDDRGAYFTHKQDETTGDHFFEFNIESSTSGTMYYSFQTAGTEKVRISDDNGIVVDDITINGNDITISETGTSDVPQIKIDSAGHGNIVIDRGGTSYDANMIFQTAGATKWRLWLDGADTTLAIRDEAQSNDLVTFTSNSGMTVDGNITANDITLSGAIRSNADVTIHLDDNADGDNVFRIRNSGDTSIFEVDENANITTLGDIYVANAERIYFGAGTDGDSQSMAIYTSSNSDRLNFRSEETDGVFQLAEYGGYFPQSRTTSLYVQGGVQVDYANVRTSDRGIYFGSARDTGFYASATDTIRFTDNISVALNVLTGGKFVSDKGTATTGTFAEFKVDTDRVMSISYPVDDGAFEFDNNNNYIFKTDGSQRLQIADAFVKVGTSANAVNLLVQHDGSTSSGYFGLGAGNDIRMYYDGSHFYVDTDQVAQSNTYFDTKSLVARLHDRFVIQDTDDSNETIFDFNTGGRTLTIGATDGNDDVATTFYGDVTVSDNTDFNGIVRLSADGSASDNFLSIGDGDDLKIYHDSNDTRIRNFTGNLVIANEGNDKDIIFQNDDNSGGMADWIALDGSEFKTLFKVDTRHQDNIYAYFGSDSDAYIRWANTDTSLDITNTLSSGDITISVTGSDGVLDEYMRFDGGTQYIEVSKTLDMNNNNIRGVNTLIYNDIGVDEGLIFSGSAGTIKFEVIDDSSDNIIRLKSDGSTDNIFRITNVGSGSFDVDLTDNSIITNYGANQKTIINTQLIDLSKTANLVPSDWAEDTSGSASTELYAQNGADTENSIVWGDGSTYPLSPHGSKALLWRAESDGDDSSHGGFISDQVPIDHTQTYQFSVWIYWVDKGDASGYHGVVEDSTDILNLNGTSNTNPYFRSNLQTSNVVAGEWYLSVGYVHGSGTTGTTNYGAVYRQLDGQVAITSTDFRFTTSATTIGTRAFMYYDSSGDAEAFFFDPRIHLVDGSEPSPQQLLGSDPRDFVTLSTTQTITGAKTFPDNTLLYFGDSNDGNLRFDGSYFKMQSGQIWLDATSSNIFMDFGNNFYFRDGSNAEILVVGQSLITQKKNSTLLDSIKLQLGSDADASLYHDDTDFHIENTKGFLDIINSGSDIRLQSAGNVTIELDTNQDGNNYFRIVDGNDNTDFIVGENLATFPYAYGIRYYYDVTSNYDFTTGVTDSGILFSTASSTRDFKFQAGGSNTQLQVSDTQVTVGVTDGQVPLALARYINDSTSVYDDLGVIRPSATNTGIGFDYHSGSAFVLGLKLTKTGTVDLTQSKLTIGGLTGSNGQVLTTDGSGNISWETVSSGGGSTSFTLTADSGTNQTISDSNTMDIAGGTGISTVVGATDTVTINIDLTSAEFTQLQNIDSSTISATQWGYVGGLNQALTTTSSVTFAGLTLNGNLDMNANSIVDIEQLEGTDGSGWLDFNMDTDNVYPQSTTDNQTVLGSVTHMNFVGDSNANGTGGEFYWGYGQNISDDGTFTQTMSLDRSGNLEVIGDITSNPSLTNASTSTYNALYVNGTEAELFVSASLAGNKGAGISLVNVNTGAVNSNQIWHINHNPTTEKLEFRWADPVNSSSLDTYSATTIKASLDNNGNMTLASLTNGANQTVNLSLKANQYADSTTNYDTTMVFGITTSSANSYGYLSAPRDSSTSSTETIRFFDSHTQFLYPVRVGNENSADARLLVSADDTSPDLSSATPSDFTAYFTNSDVNYGTMFGTLGSGVGLIQQRRSNNNIFYGLNLQPYGGNLGVALSGADPTATLEILRSDTTGFLIRESGVSMVEESIYTYSSNAENVMARIQVDSANTNFYDMAIGLAMHNDDVTAGNYSPMVAFSTHENGNSSTGNSVVTAFITAQHNARVANSWSEGDLVFGVNNGGTPYEAMRLHQEGNLEVSGNITATSFGNITEANLLDKTDNETVTGRYTFQGANGGGAIDFVVIKNTSAVASSKATLKLTSYDQHAYISSNRTGENAGVDLEFDVTNSSGTRTTGMVITEGSDLKFLAGTYIGTTTGNSDHIRIQSNHVEFNRNAEFRDDVYINGGTDNSTARIYFQHDEDTTDQFILYKQANDFNIQSEGNEPINFRYNNGSSTELQYAFADTTFTIGQSSRLVSTVFNGNVDIQVPVSANLELTSTSGSGSPAQTTYIKMRSEHGGVRGQGIFYEDVGATNEQWYSGLPYSGSFNIWQVGFDRDTTSGDSSNYQSNGILKVFDTGSARYVRTQGDYHEIRNEDDGANRSVELAMYANQLNDDTNNYNTRMNLGINNGGTYSYGYLQAPATASTGTTETIRFYNSVTQFKVSTLHLDDQRANFGSSSDAYLMWDNSNSVFEAHSKTSMQFYLDIDQSTSADSAYFGIYNGDGYDVFKMNESGHLQLGTNATAPQITLGANADANSILRFAGDLNNNGGGTKSFMMGLDYSDNVFRLNAGNSFDGTANGFAMDSSGNMNFAGDVVVTGDLTVSGTTTTINTATLDVEDKNITLNFGSGDTSASVDGAGITIQDAVDANTDATILWSATNDRFEFSHGMEVSGLAGFGGATPTATLEILRSDTTGFLIRESGVSMLDETISTLINVDVNVMARIQVDSAFTTNFLAMPVGLAMHNDNATTNNYSPIIAFSTHTDGNSSTGGSSLTAFITAQHTSRPGSQNFTKGDLVFGVNNGTQPYEAMRLHEEGNLEVSGNITATSFGDIAEADLLDKSATETVSGAYTFSTIAKFYGNSGRPFEWGDTSGLGALSFDGSANPVITSIGADDLVFHTNNINNEFFRLDHSGALVDFSKKIRIDNTGDVELASTAHPFQIGSDNTANLRMDNNEIAVVNNGSVSTLYIQGNGGAVEFIDESIRMTSAGTLEVDSTIKTPFSGSSTTPNFQANGGNFRIYNNTNTYLYNSTTGGHIYLYNDDADKGVYAFVGTNGFRIYEESPQTEIFRVTENGAISTQGQSSTGNYDLFNIGVGRYNSTSNAVATISNFASSTNNAYSGILKLKYTGDSSLNANNHFIRFEDSSGFVGAVTSEVVYSTFTGSHISAVDDVDNYRVGMIVSATGLTSDYVGIDNAQIRVQISDSPKDKRVMGVYTETLCLAHTEEELNEHGMWCDTEDEVDELPKGEVKIIPHECKEWHYSDSEGNRIRCNKEHFKSWSIHEDVIQYNAVGEGMVLVSNVDGDIQTGDYITTSTHAGIGVLQDDDILHSYTVAKITQDIDWDNIEVDEEYGIKIALVTCTYHCG